MREVVFRVLAERPGHVEAAAADPVLRIAAPSLEELHHEAREALIQALGAAHCAYRVRIRRNLPSALSALPPLPCAPALCG
jgi:hypothetical protein